mmetsp:Transcript_11716/g.19046  ORF Transcript_11716/g.19046 Transcript_11716/m.19046 type:complete len:324 (+) Transcript_11716:136-1107(+)|eukprot:CAMPEP_0184656458 /NCGR_PEP_ID=MMETSP0308-20130426/16515_1 /TAXON_ID=38269 /ORGANISM="Gloeochaete witrockiana, Strain SAG 46.84" /LENGTH=323 /DNA_ID=CAMNT_0027093603 /DNA_START=64 /DNA_END=1035 /DNA_ORIENTATION=-
MSARLRFVIFTVLFSLILFSGDATALDDTFEAGNEINHRPVIGILTQPSDEPIQSLGRSYIASSYVKFVESAGARVLPVRYDASFSELQQVFQSINGLIIPGGSADIQKSPYYFAVEFLFHLALKANDEGDYFPIWGTCNGFEMITYMVGQEFEVLTTYDAENYTVPLVLTEEASTSRLFGACPKDLMTYLSTKAITMNNHRFGVAPSAFKNNAKLLDFFRVLSTNVDRNGYEFVSTIEGKRYPVYGAQWHPEKNQFEWDPLECIDHSGNAIRSMQYIADFIVSESRRSAHQIAPSLEVHLSVNLVPIYTYDKLRYFQQCYFF